MDFNRENIKDNESDIDFEVLPTPMDEMYRGITPNYFGMQFPYRLYDDMYYDYWGMNMMDDGDYEDYYRGSEEEHVDEEVDKNYEDKNVNNIFTKIEKYNPGVLEYMRSCGVPYEKAKRIVQRNIELALMYYEDKEI